MSIFLFAKLFLLFGFLFFRLASKVQNGHNRQYTRKIENENCREKKNTLYMYVYNKISIAAPIPAAPGSRPKVTRQTPLVHVRSASYFRLLCLNCITSHLISLSVSLPLLPSTPDFSQAVSSKLVYALVLYRPFFLLELESFCTETTDFWGNRIDRDVLSSFGRKRIWFDYETYTASMRYMTPNTKKAKPPPSVTLYDVR